MAIAEELHELQHQMAAKTFFLRLRAGKLDDETIAFFSKIAAAYRGDERFERVLKVLPALRAMPVEARSEHDATRGVSLSKMDAVLLEVHRNEIVQFSIHEQRWLLKLLQRLGYWNEQVSFLKGQFDRTFASPGEATRAKIITNLENGYAQLADEAVWIASYIENAPKRFQVSSR